MLSGTMGPLREDNIFLRGDNTVVIDSYIYKTYTRGEKTITSRFYFTVSGKKADKLLKYFHEDDNVMITGKLATRVDETGHYWVTIIASNFTKMGDEQEFN